MGSLGIISLLVILANFYFSYKGFSSRRFYNRYSFQVDQVLVYKDYKRLVTSGFLHVSWTHLIFNMISLYLFSWGIVNYIGNFEYLLIYAISLVGGNLLSLLIHRSHGDYSSVGASGAVSGIIFASIALFPGIGISFFGLPISIPAWLYGLAYVLYSIYGIRSRSNNIGHEAHLGGGIIGLLTALALHPSIFLQNYPAILVIFVPAVLFIYFIVKRPGVLLVDNLFFKTHRNYTLEDRYNLSKKIQEQEIDRILEKIHKNGVKSLTRSEKEKLKAFSKAP